MLTNLRDDKLTITHLLTFKIYFKFETTTYSLTGVKSRDASASKKVLSDTDPGDWVGLRYLDETDAVVKHIYLMLYLNSTNIFLSPGHCS